MTSKTPAVEQSEAEKFDEAISKLEQEMEMQEYSLKNYEANVHGLKKAIKFLKELKNQPETGAKID